MKRHLVAALAMGLVFAGPANSFDLNDMSEEERAAFRAEIRAYLLDNPEVIMEAVAVLEQRDAQNQAKADKDMIAENAAALFEDPDSWVGGNLQGDVTMVEFVDYRCGYCRKAHDEVEALISQDANIRMIVKEFPILGEDSVRSSQFAIAVRQIAGDDAYKAASDALIKLKGKPTPPVLSRLAGTLGLNADEVMDRMDSDEVNMVIAANRALGQQLQINGTPTFVLGDQMLRGYLPLDGMQAIVADIRNQ